MGYIGLRWSPFWRQFFPPFLCPHSLLGWQGKLVIYRYEYVPSLLKVIHRLIMQSNGSICICALDLSQSHESGHSVGLSPIDILIRCLVLYPMLSSCSLSIAILLSSSDAILLSSSDAILLFLIRLYPLVPYPLLFLIRRYPRVPCPVLSFCPLVLCYPLFRFHYYPLVPYPTLSFVSYPLFLLGPWTCGHLVPS